LKKLKPAAQLQEVAGGDHSFKVPKKLGIPQEQIYHMAQDHIVGWMRKIIA
jgi:hypothetical protein